MKKCLECNKINKNKSKFCVECGAELKSASSFKEEKKTKKREIKEQNKK